MRQSLALRLLAVGGLALAALAPAGPASAYVDTTSPSVGWRPAGGIVYSMIRADNMIILGGTFTSMVSSTGATSARSRLAAIDASSGALLSWRPDPNGTVRALAASPDGQTIYVGGDFTSVGGASRTNLAAVQASNGTATSFTANTSGSVRALEYDQDGLLVGGLFGTIKGVSRGRGAEVDPVSGAVRAWNPRANNGIYAISPAQDGSGVFIGGTFTSASSVPLNRLALVARSDGSLRTWRSGSTCRDETNPCTVFDLEVADGRLIAGMGGPGGRVTALDAATGSQLWWAGGDGDMQVVEVDGGKVYAGGHFADSVSGQSRAGLVALAVQTGGVLPDLNAQVVGGSGVWAIMRDVDVLRFAGQFTSINGATIGKYSSFPVLPDPADVTPPSRPGGLRLGAALPGMVTLQWDSASDNVATTAYRVYRDGAPIETTSSRRYRDLTVSPSTSYSYRVSALDGSGNESSLSSALNVATEALEPTLLARGAQWNYLSTGTAPTGSWTQAGYTPSGWAADSGEFGFGDGDEITYISPLGVAHYFRSQFTVQDVTTVSDPRVRLLVDDGAVVYVNGQEVARVNMPSGPVGNSTLATVNVEGSAEMSYREIGIPVSVLQTGSNALAVSAHNYSATSSDASMDAFIEYVSTQGPQPPAQVTGVKGSASDDSVTLTWSPAAGATSYTVVRDGAPTGTTGGTSFTDTGLVASTSYTYEVFASNAQGDGPASAPLVVSTTAVPPPPPDPPGTVSGLRVTGVTSTSVSLGWDAVTGAQSYRVLRDGSPVGTTAQVSYSDAGLAPGTGYTYRVVAVNAAGEGPASDPVSATTSAAPVTQYVSPGAVWRIDDTGADLGTAWRDPGFDDAGWKQGRAQWGYGDGDEATVISWGPSSSSKYITYYGRVRFDAGASVAGVQSLRLRAVVDDAAVVFLNGVEVWRYNLPAGTITAQTRASTYVAGAAESAWMEFALPSTALVPGVNTVAVEVHQDAPSSSDLSFDLDLSPVG